MALGFEKMEKGSLQAKWQDRTIPLDKHMEVMVNERGFVPAPPGEFRLFACLPHAPEY